MMLIRKLALFALLGVGLAGCFDLDQGVWIGRDGSGHYDMTIAAGGALGEAMKSGKSDVHIGNNPNLPKHARTVIANGKVTQIESVDFKQLSDLSLSNETVAIKVHGHDLFGLGTTHAIFRRTFLIDHEMRKRGQHEGDDEAGKSVIASMFGDHTYVFRVHLPGSIDWIAPVYAGGLEVKPEVRADAGGYDIVWRMPLTSMIETRAMHFSVGFSSFGALNDSQSREEEDSKDHDGDDDGKN
jgi:hypothetical protein